MAQDNFERAIEAVKPLLYKAQGYQEDLVHLYANTGLVNYLAGGGVWDPSIRGLYTIPAELYLSDVLSAIGLSLGLSFFITLFPARRAARLNPVEALRYE